MVTLQDCMTNRKITLAVGISTSRAYHEQVEPLGDDLRRDIRLRHVNALTCGG